MTVKDYLKEVFLYINTDEDIEFYKVSVQGKGELYAEYNQDDETVALIHVDRSGRDFNYFANNYKKLKETVEYCLGPIITDSQWSAKDKKDESTLDDEDWDTDEF
jgi:hypothetical protein